MIGRRRQLGRATSEIEISEINGVRQLHLGSDTVQSAMRITDPTRLELSYTRSMMAFLLFNPEPAEILMVGLGGGSQAKWLRERLPTALITVIEIDPRVIAVARSHFAVPADDERFQIIAADACEYLNGVSASADVIMLDGFSGKGLVPSLMTTEFYTRCRQALSNRGLLVANLWGSSPYFDDHVATLSEVFNNQCLQLSAASHGNVAVIAFKRAPTPPTWTELKTRAERLQVSHNLEFPEFVAGLRRRNPHSDTRLLI